MKTSERATQIWPLLVQAALNRQTLTYERLAQLITMSPAGLGQLLEPIQSYCLLNELPPLTILVVSKKSGVPGVGFIAAQDIPRQQAVVFEYSWLDRRCPTPEEFAEAVAKRPSNGVPSAGGSQLA